MKKFYSLVLMAAALLVGTNAWADYTPVFKVGDVIYAYDGTLAKANDTRTETDGEDHTVYVYKTVDKAWDSAQTACQENGTIQLVGNCVLTSNKLTISKNLTLDLNGYDITNTYTGLASYCHAIAINASKALVINNSSDEQSEIKSTNASSYPINFGGANSTVTINGNIVLTSSNTSGTQIFVGSYEGITINNNTSDDFKIMSHKGFTNNKNGNPYSRNVIIGTLANFTTDTDAQNWVDWFDTYPNAKISVASQINMHPDYFEALKGYLEDQNVHTLLSLTGNKVPTLLVSTSDFAEKPIVVEIGGVEYHFTSASSAMSQSSAEHPATLTGDWISIGTSNFLPSQKTSNYYLDLNGHTYYTNNGSYIMKNGKLTISNSAEQPAYIRPYDDQQLAVILIKPIYSGSSVAIELNIGQNIIVQADKALANGIAIEPINTTTKLNCQNTVINFDGRIDVTSPECMAMYTNGNLKDTNNFPVINIQEHAVLNATKDVAIYGAGYAKWNIVDGASITGGYSAIEMRAGNLTIDGGTFTALSETSSVIANGNGSTTIGSAISIAQHTTKLPIEVVINDGDFRAIYPIAQYNPQKNDPEYVDQVNITVNGGKFWATNTANVAAYTQDNKLTLNGGYYNLAPHAFVADGHMAFNNTDAAPAPTAAEGYLFKVGEYVEEPKTTITDGNWVVETTWESTEVPTEVTAVTIPANGEVFIQPTGADEVVAYASSLDLEAGATLTIKDGATLVLGKDADVDANANLVVEEGGQLLIAPTATPVQPVGSVTLVADGAGLKAGKSDHTDPANLYWQHFAIPTVGAPSIALSYPNGTPITEPITYYNTWDIVNGWESIVKGDLTEPFVGYNFSNIKDFGTNVNYTFTGQLVGNASSSMNFTRRGFNFFGNSYLAPINIQALQSSMYEQGLEFTVYIFTKQGKRQTYRAINEVTASIYGIDEIKPMQGFFMFAEKATEADFQYNSSVYSAFINKQNGGASSAPARRATSKYDAKAIIGIESAEGEYDEVVLVASNDFSDEYDLKADARKMENAGMNIYADGSFDYLAVMATNDLMGQTLSFKAGNEAQYTMTFSGIEGELAIRDNVTGAIIAMEEGASYEFAAQPNSAVEGRFEIVPAAKMPTAIENTEVKANVKGIYTLTGQYVGEDFKALPAGVYVVNGVKIVK